MRACVHVWIYVSMYAYMHARSHKLLPFSPVQRRATRLVFNKIRSF